MRLIDKLAQTDEAWEIESALDEAARRSDNYNADAVYSVSATISQLLLAEVPEPLVSIVRIVSAQTGTLSAKRYAYFADEDLRGGTFVEVMGKNGRVCKGVVQPRHLYPATAEDRAAAKSKILRVVA